MWIRDITLTDVRAGKNWRVANLKVKPEKAQPYGELEIEPLDQYGGENEIVYSGILVYIDRPVRELKRLCKLCNRRKHKHLKESLYPPDYPKDLAPNAKIVVEPILMVKLLDVQCWDYLEFIDRRWRQIGIKPNPYPPFSHEFFANPLDEDPWFDVCDDNGPIRELHKRAFREWIEYWKVSCGIYDR